MRILVSGAGGFLGQHVVARLLERGHNVRAMVRPGAPIPRWGGDVDVFAADLRVANNLDQAFDKVDGVLHLAAAVTGGEDAQFASTVVATERFLESMAKSSVKRLVHVSSFVVYDWATAKKVLDEETPLAQNIYGMGGYTIAKVWQERLVSRATSQNGWITTIIRPGFIWGPSREDIAGMGRRIGPIHVMFGPFTRLPLCHVVNCADCLSVAIENTAAENMTFNVVDSDHIRVWRYAKAFGRVSGKRAIFVPLPYTAGLMLAKAASFVSRQAYGKEGKLPSLLVPRRFESQFKPLRFSNQRIKRILGWTPPLSFEQCLELSLRGGKAAL
jgi:UDP-glucose 4-epimerase